MTENYTHIQRLTVSVRLLHHTACKHMICLQSTCIVLFPGHRCSSWLFYPQILTDALEGCNSLPSAEARELRSNIGKPEMCVYHCQTDMQLGIGMMESYVNLSKHLKSGHFSRLLMDGRNLHSLRKRKHSAETVYQWDWFL